MGHRRQQRSGTAWFVAVPLLMIPACNYANRPHWSGDRPLHVAAEFYTTKEVERLVAERADLNGRDAQGRTPLHRAAGAGTIECARLLLDQGADVNAQDVRLQTPLHKAAAGMHGEVVKLLLDHGAQVNILDESGNTPLGAASEVVGLRWPAEDNIRGWGTVASSLLQAGGTYGHTDAHHP
ncbi:MAG: ankyrin repeat domain-containing protein, partial [Planctomycetota bacterium]